MNIIQKIDEAIDSTPLTDLIAARHLLSRNVKLVKDYPEMDRVISYLDHVIEEKQTDTQRIKLALKGLST